MLTPSQAPNPFDLSPTGPCPDWQHGRHIEVSIAYFAREIHDPHPRFAAQARTALEDLLEIQETREMIGLLRQVGVPQPWRFTAQARIGQHRSKAA